MYNLFSSKEILKNDLGQFKLYDIKYNGKTCTKMYFTNVPPTKYEVLRSAKHPNVIPVYKITTHSVYTKKIVPFREVKSGRYSEYNEYVVFKIREAIGYLESELRIRCRGLTEDGLFVDQNGNVVIGDFSGCENIPSKGSTTENIPDSIAENRDITDNTTENTTENTADKKICDDVNREVIEKLSKSIANKEPAEIKSFSEIFKILEDPGSFSKKRAEEKRETAEKILEERGRYPPQIKRNILKLFLDDISDKKSGENEHKVFVANFLVEFDEGLFREYAKPLFGIMNTAVRLVLLERLQNVQNTGEFLGELCLGLQVRERGLKTRTIRYIFDNEAVFSEKDFIYIFGVIQKAVSDEESVDEICRRLVRLRRADLAKPVYRVLLRFLELGKARGAVLRCLLQLYESFDMYKISVELLPLLCSQLSYSEEQDACFLLVGKVLEHLRSHKERIKSKDWSLKKITKLFTGKKKTKESMSERIDKIRIEENEEWDEREFQQ